MFRRACRDHRKSNRPFALRAKRLLPEIFQLLFDRVTARLEGEQLDDGRWYGHRTFLIDGSSFLPDEPELQAVCLFHAIRSLGMSILPKKL